MYVAVSASYQVYGDHLLPRTLIEDAGIVAQDVYPSEGFCSFLQASLRAGKKKYLYFEQYLEQKKNSSDKMLTVL